MRVYKILYWYYYFKDFKLSTEQYLAPEMLTKAGHGKAIDWYGLGVLLFEMLVGITPGFSLSL